MRTRVRNLPAQPIDATSVHGLGGIMKVVSRLLARARVIGGASALVLGAVGASHVAAQGGDEARVSKTAPTPLPVVSVRRVGDHFVVRYRFRSWPSDPRRHPAT